MESKQYIKDTAAAGMKGLLFSLVIFSIIIWLDLGLWYNMAIMFCVYCILSYINKSLNIKGIILYIISIFIILGTYSYFGKYGLWGFVIASLIAGLIFIGRNWKQFIKAKQQVETIIFGKPLKQYKIDGEKIPKVEFEFKRKTNNHDVIGEIGDTKKI